MATVNGTAKPHTNGTVPITKGNVSYAAKHKLADHFIGGNKLENAPASAVKDFVAHHDGHTVITNVSLAELPANKLTRAQLTPSADSDCQQRYCGSQGDSVRSKMGLRNIWQREGHPVHSYGYSRGFTSKRGLHSDGRSIR